MIPLTSTTRRRASAIGAWSLVLTGVTHAAAIAAGAAASTPAAELAARQAMADAHIDIAGLDRTLWQLFMGFSLTMAVFVTGLGALNLLVLRLAPQLFLTTRAALWVNLSIALPAFALAVLLFPPPPIALLGVASVAFGVALTRPTSTRPDARPLTSLGLSSS